MTGQLSTASGGGGGSGQQHNGGGTKWSGLETTGMREAKCSLLLQDDVPYDAKIKSLAKQRVLVYQDRGFNPAAVRNHSSSSQPQQHQPQEDNFYVDFKGATILQLEPGPNVQHKTMPVTITVGGRCVFTPENYQDFRVMMRTKEQAQEMDISPNGNFDWPDVSSLLLCPVCGERGPIPRDSDGGGDNTHNHGEQQHDEYWMIFYPLLQICVMKGSQLTLGTRSICRLVCLECMEDLLDGITLTVQPGGRTRYGGITGSLLSSSAAAATTARPATRSTRLAFTLPAADVLAEAGSASFLEDGPPRPDTHPHIDDILDSWTLYNLWEHSGAWEALQNDYRVVLSRSMQVDSAAAATNNGDNMSSNNNNAVANIIESKEEDEVEPRLKERMGKQCGNPKCQKMHGRTDEDGQIIRLSMKCRDCQAEFYCSKVCRESSRESHLPECERRRRDREERREKKAKKVECDTCHQKFPHTIMKKCSRCRNATYCSVECQRGDWDRHKNHCQQILR